MPIELTSFKDFDTATIGFSEPYTIYPHDNGGDGNNSSHYSSYQKVFIQKLDPSKTQPSDLILSSPSRLMCLGIQEKKDRETGRVIGYQIPIILWNRKGASEQEKEFTTTLQNIVECCEGYVQSQYDHENPRLNLISWRQRTTPSAYAENGGASAEALSSAKTEEEYPVLYVKLITNRQNERIMTLFINEDTNEEIDPSELFYKRFLLTAAIKFETMYIGKNLSLQVKLYEVLVKFIEPKKKNVYQPSSLLRPSVKIEKRRKKTSGAVAQAVVPDDKKIQTTNRFEVLKDDELED